MQEQLEEEKKNEDEREKESQLGYELLANQKEQIKAQQAEIKELKETIESLKRFDGFASAEVLEKDHEIERLVEENSLLKECQETNLKLRSEKEELAAAKDAVTRSSLSLME